MGDFQDFYNDLGDKLDDETNNINNKFITVHRKIKIRINYYFKMKIPQINLKTYKIIKFLLKQIFCQIIHTLLKKLRIIRRNKI